MDETTRMMVKNECGRDTEERLTLGNQAVQILEVGSFDVQVSAADVVNGLIVNHETAVGVLEGGMGGKN